jgi:hypothetical protein
VVVGYGYGYGYGLFILESILSCMYREYGKGGSGALFCVGSSSAIAFDKEIYQPDSYIRGSNGSGKRFVEFALESLPECVKSYIIAAWFRSRCSLQLLLLMVRE